MSGPALLAGLFEALPLAAFLVDDDVTVLLANRLGRLQASETAEGIATDPRRGGALLRCVHDDDVPEGCGRGPACGRCDLRGVVADALTAGQASHRDCTLHLRVGEEQRVLTARASAAPLQYTGERLVVLTLAAAPAAPHVDASAPPAQTWP